jgi:hypothetical protein
MLPEEKGIYIDLLCYQHQNGNLPIDTKRLAKIVGIAHEEFIKLWEVVSLKFVNENERLINLKLQSVMFDRAEKGHTNKISGTFAAVLRKADLSKKDYNFIRKEFKIDDFKQIDSERLTERLTEWLQERLKSIANANAIEDIILNGSEEKKDDEEKIEIHPLQTYVKDKFERVSKLEKQLTFEECEKLLKKYTKPQISKVLVSMENWKGINKKVSVYLTLLNWLDKEYDNQDATIPPKKELKEIPASYIFNDVKIDYGNYPHNED